MLLFITRSYDPTVDYVIERLAQYSIPYQRLNTDTLLDIPYTFRARALDWSMALDLPEGQLKLSDVSSVLYRRPESPKISALITDPQHQKGVAAEAEALMRNVYSLLANATWMSNPDNIRAANTKLGQLAVAQKLGLTVPETMVTSLYSEAQAFAAQHNGRLIIKSFTPIFYQGAEAEERMGSYTVRLGEELQGQLHNVDLCPTIIQAEVPKLYEMRVTVFGDQVFAAKINSAVFSAQEVDWRKPIFRDMIWEQCDLDSQIASKCVSMVKHYGLLYGAFDFAVTPEGQYVFFELNPNGQWGWIAIDTGMPLAEALLNTLDCI